MYARLLILTKQIQLAAQAAALPRRCVIRVTTEEWGELNADPQFAQIHNGREWTILNDVLVKHDAGRPATSDTTAHADKLPD